MKAKAGTFRATWKQKIQPLVPVSLARAIRVKAAKERRSISEVSTEALARGLGLDPASYGIAAESPHNT